MIDNRDASDPAATDLFFGLAAILVVLLCITSQTLQTSRARSEGRDETALQQAITHSGRWVILAQEQGLILRQPGAAPVSVPADDILSGDVDAWALAAEGLVWVIIEAEAADSAFLLDTALARAGLSAMRRIRLVGTCRAPQLSEDGVICHG